MDSTDFDIGWARKVPAETIKRVMVNLFEGINAVALAVPLREQAVLNDDQIDKALAMAAPIEQNRSLMLSLRNGVNDERLEAFLTCLTSSGHEELADKLKKTYREVKIAFGTDGATAASWLRPVGGGDDMEQGTNLVPRDERDNQEWLATSFSRYRSLWLRGLKYTDTFVDVLEENGVPPYILSRVEEVSRRRKVLVLLDMLSTAGLQTYDAFKVALEKTEQNDLVALLEEKPRDEAERLLIGQRKEELAHLVPSVVVRVAGRDLPASRLKLNVPRPPDKAGDALMAQVVEEVEKCYVTEPVAKLFEELLPCLDLKTPALAIEQVARVLFADRSVTMSAIAVFLCISAKVVLKVIPETHEHVPPVVRAATDTLCHFAFWLTRCEGWAAFLKDARDGIDTYVGKVNWNRFLSKTKKQGVVIVGPPHAESDAAVAALCARLSRLLPIDVVSATDVDDMLTQFDTGALRLLNAFRMSYHGVVVVVTTPGARGGNTGPPWFGELVGVLETAPEDTRRLVPVGFFGAKREDFIPAVRSLKVVDAFPDEKKRQSEALIDAAAGKIKIEYDAIMQRIKLHVVGDWLKSVIDKEENNPYDLLLQMERYQHGVPLDKVRDSENFNILHMAVFSQEPLNLKVVFYMNLWGELRQQVVEPGRRCSNLTPRDLAEKLLFKSKGPQVAEEFDYLEARFFRMSDLSKACLAGKQQFVSRLLTYGTSGVNAGDCSGSTPLFCAAAAGHVDLMELLVKHGADAAVVNDRQETCLHVAASLGRADAVDFLLCLGVLDPNAPDSSLMRPIEYAAANGDLATLKVFQAGRVPLDDSLVCLATKGQRVDMVRHLVEKCGCGVEGVDALQRTPLHHAAIQGHVELLRFLVRKGANLSHRDKIKKNLLHHLAEHYKDDGKRRRAAKYLIELLQERGLMRTMLRDHDSFGGKDLLMLLTGRINKKRRAWKYVEVKRSLLSQFKKKRASGSNDVLEFGPVRHSGFGMTPGQDVLDEIDKLVNDRLSGDSKDCTPLHLAVSKDHTSLVTEFIALGADVNAKDYFDLTPLHLVAITGNMDVVKLLEEKGAYFPAKDVDGKTAKDVAEDNEQERVLNFLRDQETISLVRNFVVEVEKNCHRLDEPVLQAKRAAGQDLKDHIVAVLRDVQIDTNKILLNMGFGPIMQETEPPGSS